MASNDLIASKLIEINIEPQENALTNTTTVFEKESQAFDFKSQMLEQQQNDYLLRSILDTSLVSIALLAALRDDEGNITDFEIKMVNNHLNAKFGQNELLGKNCFTLFPTLIDSGVFSAMVNVVNSGRSHSMEYSYPFGSREVWVSGTFTKLGDGLLVNTLDITDKVNARIERSKELALQKQFEKLAVIASWEYDLQTQKLFWSPGMYRIYKRKETLPVMLETYLEVSSAESLITAERLVKNISSGLAESEELISIVTDNGIKMIQVSTEVCFNSAGDPLKILGVDRDISTEVNLQMAKWELEQKQRDIEKAQGQLLFKAALNSQEEERIRIAESLHNGVGQMLYGIKLNLEQLNKKTLLSNETEFEEIRRTTDQLIYQTIQEVRNLSHELSPALLERLGLKLAIENICSQYRKQISFNCEFRGNETGLDKFLQTTIYRTAQELALNVVKHSKARNATIKIVIALSEVTIVMSDDGVGPDPTKKSEGIGLSTIANNIALLSGTIELNANLDRTNVTRIVIPIMT